MIIEKTLDSVTLPNQGFSAYYAFSFTPIQISLYT